MDAELKTLLGKNHEDLLKGIKKIIDDEVASRIEETNRRINGVADTVNKGVASINSENVVQLASRIEQNTAQIRGTNALLLQLLSANTGKSNDDLIKDLGAIVKIIGTAIA